MPIDGNDNRYNYWALKVSDKQRNNANSVGMIIPKSALKVNQDGTFKIQTLTYGENCSLSYKDKFYYEPVIFEGAGTCFSIKYKDQNLIITARHIVDVAIELGHVRSLSEFVCQYCVVFGFISGACTNNFPKDNIYYLSDDMVRTTFPKASQNSEDDFIIFQAQRDIPSALQNVWFNISMKKVDRVYLIGHPLKMLLKIILDGKINEGTKEMNNLHQTQDTRFSISSDVFLYNSGSPVFDAQNHKILGMVVSNDTGPDFICKNGIREYYKVEKFTSKVNVINIKTIIKNLNHLHN
jgi:hypothetical protein